MKERLAVLLFGVGFGFVLGWARLNDPDVIYAMLRLREPYVFLIMGSAIATATLGVRLLRARQARAVLDGSPVSWRIAMPTRDHVLGSILFGLGWSISCTCPGPITVQIGRGEISGAFIAIGLLSGIAIRDATRGTRVAPAGEPVPNVAASLGL
jgi:uncharacterized membrane protein YedE/YeeE